MWFAVNDRLALDALFFNFLPSWWHRHYGVEFGRRYVFDPDYRLETQRFIQRTVVARFPELHIGSADPEPAVIAPDFGNAVTPAAAGCQVEYPLDNYPWNYHLAEEEIERLVVPDDPRQVFPYSEIISQVHYLADKLGQDARPWLPTRGVLNDAALIRGVDVLGDLALGTPASQHLLAYSHGILARNAELNYGALGYTGAVMLTNCTAAMVSPRMYRQRLLPYDAQVYATTAAHGADLSIHHCGVFDGYIPVYRTLPRVTFLEIGWDSDVRAALQAFPEAVIQYILSATYVASATPAELRARVQALLRAAEGQLHRFRLSVPDLEYGTPDENLVEIYATCKRGLAAAED